MKHFYKEATAITQVLAMQHAVMCTILLDLHEILHEELGACPPWGRWGKVGAREPNHVIWVSQEESPYWVSHSSTDRQQEPTEKPEDFVKHAACIPLFCARLISLSVKGLRPLFNSEVLLFNAEQPYCPQCLHVTSSHTV